jgi:DNA-binding NarL/FixJ family response regulator
MASDSGTLNHMLTSNAKHRVRVAAVDDNWLILDAIKNLIEAEPNLQWAGNMRQADDLIGFAKRECPDIVVLDIVMPGRNVFEVMRELREACPDVRVIMYSGQVSRDLIDLALQCGAWEFVSKIEHSGRLIEAIRRVARGERPRDPALSPEVTPH